MGKISLYEELRKFGGADWVKEMQKFYNEKGHYRTEDLKRLLGNPMKGVSHSLSAFGSETKEEVEEMDFYLKTGCVQDYYLKNVLGDQSIAIRVMPKQYFN